MLARGSSPARVIVLPALADRPARRARQDGGRGTILLFTGVRYERPVSADIDEARRTAARRDDAIWS